MNYMNDHTRTTKSAVVKSLRLAWSDEARAFAFFEALRWGGEPYCGHCGSTAVYPMMDRKGKRNARYMWKCKEAACGKQFSVRVGTVIESSHIPLRHWVYAFWAGCSSKKGVSALQIARQTGLSYKSALFLMHRVRFAMSDDKPSRRLGGVVEIDETYIGGKPRHMADGTVRATKKMPVVALVERDGAARAWPMRRVTSRNLNRRILKNIDPEARVMTDDANLYKNLDEHFASHESVNHSAKEYARGDVSSNTAEAFFALLKRGIYGTFHSVSEQHLHRYVDEFAFRWTHRKIDDGARTLAAMKGGEGKRLLYRDTGNGAA